MTPNRPFLGLTCATCGAQTMTLIERRCLACFEKAQDERAGQTPEQPAPTSPPQRTPDPRRGRPQ